MQNSPNAEFSVPLASPNLILHVESQRLPGALRLKYRIHSDIESLYANWREMGEVEIFGNPVAFQASLAREIDQLYQGLGPGSEPILLRTKIADRLAARGQALYKQILPKPLRRFLQGLPEGVDSLMIVAEESAIPWELMCAEDGGFLSHRFSMTRWLPKSPAAPTSLAIRRLACVAAGEVAKPSLEGPSLEGRFLIELGRRHKIDCTLLENPKRSQIDDLLGRERIDLLHVGGHGESESRRPIQDGVRLAYDERLRALDFFDPSLLAWAKHRPLLFMNACHTGRSRIGFAALEGWAAAAVRQAEVGAFIAPQWSVRDHRSRIFSEKVYTALARGESLGAAVRGARRVLWLGEMKAPESFAYTVYGHPHAIVQWGACQSFDPEAKNGL